MLTPQGKDIWKGLITYFIDLDKLMHYIRQHELNGYLQVVSSKFQGNIFLLEGEAICGLLESDQEKSRGAYAVKSVLDKTRQDKHGEINVREMPYQAVDIISEIFLLPATVVHTNLSVDFLNLDSFMDRLKADRFNGYIEIHFQDGNEGIIFIKEGNIQSIVHESLQMDKDKSNKKDLKMFNIYAIKFVEKAQQLGVSYDVYTKK